MDCIFCKIIARKIPSDIVYEDDDVLAILDIAPINPGHTLVIPKRHVRDLLDVSPEAAAKVISVAQRIAPALLKVTGAPAFNCSINNGPASGQVVMHLHVHVIPRHPSDGLISWVHGKYEPGESAALAQRIVAAMAVMPKV
ncbi:MAG: HIT family protein [Patescibacteria group bacterium]|nr:HIT family protein [Patescibacteria group bacterium]